MRCHQAQRLINELLDGELREKDRSQLQAHLDSCRDCRELYEDLKAIKDTVVPADEMEPSKEVWEKLKSRLQAEVIPQLEERTEAVKQERSLGKRTRWFQLPSPVFRYGLVSLVFLALMAGAFFLGRHYRQAPQPGVQVAAENPALQKIKEAEFYYRQAIQSLTQAVEESGKGLPPEMVEILQVNLSLLDRTIELCQQAVNEQPDNLQAREYLLSAYNSKASFLNGLLETKKLLSTPGLEKL
ncbi:MAG: anti-sigma factor family protein [Candidatus Saccharicenans sp.]|uniref:anti-sigma factor family protein n=1 Tax=Candidatus Saccharicenans sp. TaxID=2819258 RepID=UPI004049B60D